MTQAVLAEAVRTAQAQRAVLIAQDDAGAFETIASTHPEDLGHRTVITELSSPLWAALLCRSHVVWSGDDARELRPLPFAGGQGWSHLLAVGIPFTGARQGLLVVGRDTPSAFDDSPVDQLNLIAALAAFALDNAAMTKDFRTLGRLLSAAVEVAARTVDAQSPEEIREILLQGLVKDMGMTAAALWQPQPGMGMVLTAAVGLPPEVQSRITTLPDSSAVARLYQNQLNVRLLQGATSHVSTVWPGMRVRLVRVDDPSGGVLGVYSTGALPDFVDGVLASLSQALSRAVHQAMLHRRTQLVADALVAELKPHGIEVPAELDVGFVYRSATRGVPIGGDFIDWFVTRGGRFGVACGDVSGKGIEAASLTAMAVYSLRAFALADAEPDVVLDQLNDVIASQTKPERFVTIAYLMVDPATGALTFASGGHPAPVLLRGSQASVLDVDADVPPGVLNTTTFQRHAYTLLPGDAVVLVTDGVTEARRLPDQAQQPGGQAQSGDEVELLGDAGVVACLGGVSVESAQEIADRVWNCVVEWTGGKTTDDCAIVVLKRRE